MHIIQVIGDELNDPQLKGKWIDKIHEMGKAIPPLGRQQRPDWTFWVRYSLCNALSSNVALAKKVVGNAVHAYTDSNDVRYTCPLTLGEEASINGLNANAIAATLHFKFDTTASPRSSSTSWTARCRQLPKPCSLGLVQSSRQLRPPFGHCLLGSRKHQQALLAVPPVSGNSLYSYGSTDGDDHVADC